MINQSGTVEETNHYYPFGGVFATAGNTQPYKYNGKELDTKKGLNWYDYGARHYDAVLGRFITLMLYMTNILKYLLMSIVEMSLSVALIRMEMIGACKPIIIVKRIR
mgnify:CR=1 FL=1